MKAFEYAAPRTEAEAVELLSGEPGHTEILAGGTDLVGLMKKMVVRPERVVNITEISSMKQIDPQEDGSVVLGAAVTLDELLASSCMTGYQAVTDAILGINSMQLQSQGTLGGEICQRPQCWFFRSGKGLVGRSGEHIAAGDNRYHAILGNGGPAKFVSSSRIAPALMALGAELRIIGPGDGEQHFVAIDEFFQTPRNDNQREHILAPNQLLTHIVLPPAGGQSSATYEVRASAGPDFPAAAAAATLELQDGIVRDAKVVLGQVAPTPWVSQEAREALLGTLVTHDIAQAAGNAALRRATPLSNNEYKVELARVAVKRAVLLAAGLETGGF